MTEIQRNKENIEPLKENTEDKNQNQTSENLNEMLDIIQKGKVPKEKMELIVNYVLKLAEIEGTYQKEKENIKNQVVLLIKGSLKNTLDINLQEYNVSKFDVDGQVGIDKQEEKNYSQAIGEVINQIIVFGGIEKFSNIHNESNSKDGILNADKYLADKVDLQSYIFGKKGGKDFAEELIQKSGNISESELKVMEENKFDPLSQDSWKELGILLAKEFGNGVEDVLRFLGNIPSGIILLPRYTKYRFDINSSDEATSTEGKIKLKELVEQNPSLGLLELLGEKGLEMIKKLGEMLTSGKQGDIAMATVTIAGLLAGGAGALKLGLNLTRKFAVKEARLAGREVRLAGKTTFSRQSRNALKSMSGTSKVVGESLSRIDDVLGGAGIGHLTGQFSNTNIEEKNVGGFDEASKVEKKEEKPLNVGEIKNNIEESKIARNNSNFKGLVGKEGKILDKIKYEKVKGELLNAFNNIDTQKIESLLKNNSEYHQKIFDILLNHEYYIKFLTSNLEKFTQIDKKISHIILFNKLIENGQIMIILNSLEKFTGILDKKLYNQKLFDNFLNIKRAEENIYFLVRNLEKFNGLNRKNYLKLFNKLLKDGNLALLLENLEKFKGLKDEDYLNLANKLIESGNGEILIQNLEKFKGLKDEYYLNLYNKLMVDGKFSINILQNLEKFDGLGKLGIVLMELKTSSISFDNRLGILLKANGDLEKIKKGISLFERLNLSKSTEVIKLSNGILEIILKLENPIKAIESIENIFIKNNLPMVGKLTRVFEQLYSDSKIESLITSNLSPTLVNQKSNNVRRFIMFRDLLKSHLLSGEPTLKSYLEILKSGEDLLKKYDSGINLSPEEQKQFLQFLNKINTLGENKQVKISNLENQFDLSNDINIAIFQVKSQLGIKDGEKIMDKISELFLKPIGLHSIDEALKLMSDTKINADTRGRDYFKNAQQKGNDYYIEDLKYGDLAKGFKSDYIGEVTKEGFVARDFLGTEGKNDATPFDIDLIKIENNTSLDWLTEQSESSKYGDIIAVIKNKGDIQEVSKDNLKNYDKNKFELFNTGVLGTDHYGIRTALPSSQIDYLIFKGDLEKLDQVFFNIAKSGVYIPVIDKTGKVIFTPEMFDNLKQSIFGGIKDFGNEKFSLSEVSKDSKFYDGVQKHLPTESEILNINKTKNSIVLSISDGLDKLLLNLKEKGDHSINGVELVDTGSTGRYTNLPGGFDFDFSAKLNEVDFKKIPEIIKELQGSFKAESFEQTITQGDFIQYIIKGAIVNGQKMDIDIGFTKYKTGKIVDSNDAISMKCEKRTHSYGVEKYNEVIANIRLAKGILKEAMVYKKGTHGQGGLGGIGVETWILNNGGNIEKAFKSFYDASMKNGKMLNFEEFKNNYKIFGAGENLRGNFVENFTNNMTEEGYKKMVELIGKYLT